MSLKDKLQKRVPKGHKRSSKWRKVRKKHIKVYNECIVCGSKKVLEVHHVEPFHINPARELDPTNLITLCDKRNMGCHFVFAHLKSWQSHNITILSDAQHWKNKIEHRP